MVPGFSILSPAGLSQDIMGLLSPITQLIPAPLTLGNASSVEDVEAQLQSINYYAQRVISGASNADAGSRIAETLASESTNLSGTLEAGKRLDSIARDAEDITQRVINDLTAISQDCLLDLQSQGAGLLNTATALSVAARHWARAEQRLQEYEEECRQLTVLVENTPIPQVGSSVSPATASTTVSPEPINSPSYSADPVSANSAPTSVPATDTRESSEFGSGAPTPEAQRAVAAATSAVGTPYQWGGTTPGVGLDCSGLTQWAYAQAGVDLPRTAEAQAVGRPVSRSELLPGDLVVWDGHVAMVVDGGNMVEAGDPVQINPIRENNIGMQFKGYYRPTG